MKNILFVEDDALYRDVFMDLLVGEGYHVTTAENAAEGMKLFKDEKFDMVISDLEMDVMSGTQLVDLLRKIDPQIRIIILTASEDEKDELLCLERNVDEYLVKTAPINVLLKRIELVFKRQRAIPKEKLSSALENIHIADKKNNIVEKNSQTIQLTRKEMDLLIYFLEHKNQVLQRDDILHAVWHNNKGYYDSRTVDTYVKKIRSKLQISSIVSVRGVGYEWAE